jgi:hypothetical protein
MDVLGRPCRRNRHTRIAQLDRHERACAYRDPRSALAASTRASILALQGRNVWH